MRTATVPADVRYPHTVVRRVLYAAYVEARFPYPYVSAAMTCIGSHIWFGRPLTTQEFADFVDVVNVIGLDIRLQLNSTRTYDASPLSATALLQEGHE